MRSGFLGVAAATAAAAVLTYVLYGTAGNSVPDADVDGFAVFWYGALIVGLGVFLPLEQVVSRALTAGPLRVAAVVRPALVLLGLAVVGVLVASPLLTSAAGPGGRWVVVALIAVALVSSMQFAARGLALGRGRLGLYAAALFADAGLRALGAVLAALLVARPPGAAFAACVVGSALVAHLGLLVAVRRPGVAAPAARELHDFGEFGVAAEVAERSEAASRSTTGAVLALLGASLAAQVLLNAGPLVRLDGEPAGSVAAYAAAFTLARAPLFVVVPVQAVLVPPMVRMVSEGRVHELRVRMGQFGVAVALLALLGAGAAALLARPAMAIFTGGRHEVPPALMALLVAGCLVHAGLVVGTQALVATGRERWVLACWGTGLAVAAVVLPVVHAVMPDLAGAWVVAWAFTAGSAAGWVLSVVLLVRRRSR